MDSKLNIAIVGGGAAGFFCALRAGERAKALGVSSHIQIFESSSSFLKKVRISGGGRCNVTHNCFDPKIFCQNYPRGHKELLSAFQQFQAIDTIEWFKKRGVKIVAESDGRMFPDTNNSETIIQCFLDEIKKLNIELKTNHSVKSIVFTDAKKIKLEFKDNIFLEFDKVLIATGSAQSGYQLSQSLGHGIAELAPSLFSFKIEDPLLQDLSGLSFPGAGLKLILANETLFKQAGPVLITHWGLSGPAILKLSAWAAREMKHADYKATLHVNWLGLQNIEDAQNLLKKLKDQNPKSQIKNVYPESFAKRFWQQLLDVSQIPGDLVWANFSKKQMQVLSENIFAYKFNILGKNRFKEEFVECGGVSLKEINFKTMQSKLHPQIYFAGELLDVDGITGGFNFQNAWTTGWIAGTHMVESFKGSELLI